MFLPSSALNPGEGDNQQTVKRMFHKNHNLMNATPIYFLHEDLEVGKEFELGYVASAAIFCMLLVKLPVCSLELPSDRSVELGKVGNRFILLSFKL